MPDDSSTDAAGNARETDPQRLIAMARQVANEQRALEGKQPPAEISDSVGSLSVRCPHCQSAVHVSSEKSLEEIRCEECGDCFELVKDVAGDRQRKQLGHFDLIEQLGSGAFGVVWKARDQLLDRLVALKLPRGVSASATSQHAFLREARTVAQLRHPHIVQVYEIGRAEDSVYISSELIEGQTLMQTCADRPRMLPKQTALLCKQLAEALHHAHENGVVHRDLKPSNVMMDSGNSPHVMDFGLAKRVAGEVTVTVEGQVLGTPAYMAPEQARGTSHHSDHRSDQYSLGVVFFELLTGELPFRGNVQAMLRQTIQEDPPRPRNLNPRVPRDLETICLKCLEKDPTRRYESCRQLANELERYLEGKPIAARPIGVLGRGMRWTRRFPVTAGLIAAVALSLILGTLVAGFFALRANQNSAELRDALKLSEARLKLSDLGMFNRTLEQASLGWRTDPKDTLQLLLDKKRCPVEFRDFSWWLMYERCLTTMEEVVSTNQPATKFAFSDDGNQFAATHGKTMTFGRCDERVITTVESPGNHVAMAGNGSLAATHGRSVALHVWNTATGELVEQRKPIGVLFGEFDIMDATFSSDAKQLAWLTKLNNVLHYATVRDLQKGEELSIGRASTVPRSDLHLSSNGKLAAYNVSHRVHLYDALSGRKIGELEGTQSKFSPDGKLIACRYGSGKLRVYSLDTMKEYGAWEPFKSDGIDELIFSPRSDRLLITGSYSEKICQWDVVNKRPLQAYWTQFRRQRGGAYADDGKSILIGCKDGTVYRFPASPESIEFQSLPNGQRARFSKSGDLQFVKHHDNATAVASHDGRLSVSNLGDRLEITGDHADRTVIATLSNTESLAAFSCIAWSHDDSRLAAARVDGTIILWDTKTWQEKAIAPATLHAKGVHAICFSPDDRTLATGSDAQEVQLGAEKLVDLAAAFDSMHPFATCNSRQSQSNWRSRLTTKSPC